MSRRYHSQSGWYSGGDPLAGAIAGIIVLMIVLSIFLAWFLCRCGAISYHTMKKNPHNKLLRTSFTIFIVLCAIGLLLSLLLHNAAFVSFGTTGLLIHAAIAKKVQVQKSPLFLSPQAIPKRILKTSWWADHPA